MLKVLFFVGFFSSAFSDNVDGIRCTDAGYFPNPNDCTKYYVCVDWFGNGKRMSIFHFDCAYGTVYDPRLFVCNHPEWIKPPPACAGGHLVVPGPVNVLPDPIGPNEPDLEPEAPSYEVEIEKNDVVKPTSVPGEVKPVEVQQKPVGAPDHVLPEPEPNAAPSPVLPGLESSSALNQFIPGQESSGTPSQVLPGLEPSGAPNQFLPESNGAPNQVLPGPEPNGAPNQVLPGTEPNGAPNQVLSGPEPSGVPDQVISGVTVPPSSSASEHSGETIHVMTEAVPENGSGPAAVIAPQPSGFNPDGGEGSVVTTTAKGEDETTTETSKLTDEQQVIAWVIVPDALLNNTQIPTTSSNSSEIVELPAETAPPGTTSKEENPPTTIVGQVPVDTSTQSPKGDVTTLVVGVTENSKPESQFTSAPGGMGESEALKETSSAQEKPTTSAGKPNTESASKQPDTPSASGSVATTDKPSVDPPVSQPVKPDDSVKFPEPIKPKPTTPLVPSATKPNNSSAVTFLPGELNFQLNCGTKEFLRLPTACDRFYKCYWISSESRLGIDLFQCDRGLLFDDVRKRCDKAENVDCPLKQNIAYSVAPGSLYDCPEPGHFPFESDCIRFYRCIEVKPKELKGLLYRCPGGYGYSEETRRCEKLTKLPPCDRPIAKSNTPLHDIPLEETTVVQEKDLDRFFSTKGFFVP